MCAFRCVLQTLWLSGFQSVSLKHCSEVQWLSLYKCMVFLPEAPKQLLNRCVCVADGTRGAGDLELVLRLKGLEI